MDERLLKGQEVALVLQVSRSYAYQLIREGKIAVVRIGRSVRVREIDLRTFITRNTSEVSTEPIDTGRERIGRCNHD
jgi:excisionase family DNA binding protein